MLVYGTVAFSRPTERNSPVAPPSLHCRPLARFTAAEPAPPAASAASQSATESPAAPAPSSSQLRVVEHLMLRRRLQLDNLIARRHHEVHVHIGARIFFVVKIEQHFAIHDAHADRRHKILDRSGAQRPRIDQPLQSQPSATNAPVIEAVRVPPSAWITSQSIQMVRSPSRFKSATARNDRPISR